MPIDYDKIKNWPFPEVVQTYTAKDSILYALGVGYGHDPVDEAQLQFVYKKNLKAAPTMPKAIIDARIVILIMSISWDWSGNGVPSTRQLIHWMQPDQKCSATPRIAVATQVTMKSQPFMLISRKGAEHGAL